MKAKVKIEDLRELLKRKIDLENCIATAKGTDEIEEYYEVYQRTLRSIINHPDYLHTFDKKPNIFDKVVSYVRELLQSKK